jgi:hypothetical protein
MERPCLVKAQVGQVWASLLDCVKVVEEDDDDEMENKCPEWLSNLYPNAQVAETTRKQVVADMILEADKGIIKAPDEVAFRLMKFGPGFWRSIVKASRNREFAFLSTVAMIIAATTKAYRPQVLMEGGAHLRKALESTLLPLVRRENHLVGKGKTAVTRKLTWWDGLHVESSVTISDDLDELAKDINMSKGLWKEWRLIDKFILSIERSPVAALNPGAKPSDHARSP